MTSSAISFASTQMSRALLLLGLQLVAPALVHAQEPWFTVNAGQQLGSNEFTNRVDVPLFQTALQIDYPVRNGLLFDAGGGLTFPASIGLGPVRIAVGGSFSVANLGHDAAVQAEIRNLLAPSAPLRFQGVEALNRSEKIVSVHVGGAVPFGDRVTLLLYGGPAHFAVSQDVISEIGLPLSAAMDAQGVGTVELHANGWGFNAGADLAFFMNEWFGVGLGVRATGTTVPLENLLLSTATAEQVLIESRAGGVQAFGGLRLRLR